MYKKSHKARKKILVGNVYQEAYSFIGDKQTITTQLDKIEHLHNKSKHKKGR